MERLLRPEGFALQMFSSARDFLDSEYRPEKACLIVDLEVTGMAALEFKKALLEKGLPHSIIVTTFSEGLKAPEVVRGLGAFAYFRKPVDGHALIDTINLAILKVTQ